MEKNMVEIGNWKYFRLDRPKAAGEALIDLLDSLELVMSTRGPMHDLQWIIKPSSRLGDPRWTIGWKAMFEVTESK